jgi:hypothetical protein
LLGGYRGTEGKDMAMVSSRNASVAASPSDGRSYRAALSMVTILFFFWGFVTVLNDILVPHLKSIFDLNYTKVMLIQFAFFSAYFIFSIPSAKVIDTIGYKKTMVAGLLTMALGAFLFLPAASAPSFPLFLGALMVLAAGITALQVAANAYVTVLGPSETASILSEPRSVPTLEACSSSVARPYLPKPCSECRRKPCRPIESTKLRRSSCRMPSLQSP